MNLLEILVGQIPEAVYFALFLVLTKKLTHKRILFTGLMVAEYLLLMYAFPYSIWSHVGFFILTFVLLKLLYSDKCQVTDVFTLGIASGVLIIISIASFVLCQGNMIIGSIINRGLMFLLLFLTRNKLNNLERLYHKFWNRNNKIKKRIKSTTFRAVNLVVFNFSFWIINICMIIAIIYNSRGGV